MDGGPAFQLATRYNGDIEELGNLPFPVIVEPKLDGMRLWIEIYDSDNIKIYTRNGKRIGFLEDALKKYRLSGGYILDGELFYKNWNATFSVYQRELTNKSTIYCFDIIDMSWKHTTPNLFERKKLLHRYLLNNKNPYLIFLEYEIVNNYEHLLKIIEKNKKEKKEGSIIKLINIPYRFNKRTSEWLKIVNIDYVTARCIDLLPGTGRNKMRLGSIVVKTGNGRIFKVGSGFSDKERDYFWKHPYEIKNKCVDIRMNTSVQKESKAIFPIFIRIRPDITC